MKHNMNRMNLIVLECYHEVCRRREAYEGKFVHIFFHLYGLLRAQEMLLNVFRATPLGSPKWGLCCSYLHIGAFQAEAYETQYTTGGCQLNCVVLGDG